VLTPLFPFPCRYLEWKNVRMERKGTWRRWCNGFEWSGHHKFPKTMWSIKILQDPGHESPVGTVGIFGLNVGCGPTSIPCGCSCDIFGHQINLLLDRVVPWWGASDLNGRLRWGFTNEWIHQTLLWTWSWVAQGKGGYQRWARWSLQCMECASRSSKCVCTMFLISWKS